MADKTLKESLDELNEARRELFMIVVHTLKIDKLADWLTKQLNKLHNW